MPVRRSGSELVANSRVVPLGKHRKLRLTIETLASVDCLHGLDRDVLQDLLFKCDLLELTKGQDVVEHTQQTDDVYFVLDGQVRVNMLAASGRPITYQTLSAGSHFGELAAVDGLPRSKNVSAESDVTLIRLSAANFNRLMNEHAEFAARVVRWLVNTTRWYSEKLFEYHTYNVRGRILAEILRSNSDPLSDSFSFSMSDREMASRVGTTRENVTRICGKLRTKGLISRDGREVHVFSARRLRDLMQQSEFR